MSLSYRLLFTASLCAVVAGTLSAGSLSGRVTGGGVTSDAIVSAIETDTLCVANSAMVSASGSYSIDDIEDGEYFLLVIDADSDGVFFGLLGNTDYLDYASATRVTINGPTLQDIELPDLGGVTGVIAAEGQNLDGAVVSLLDPVSLAVVKQDILEAGEIEYGIGRVAPGCYLVGLVLNGDDSGAPAAYHPVGDSALTAGLIEVTAGQTLVNVNIVASGGDVGELSITLNGYEEGAGGQVVAVGSDGGRASAPVDGGSASLSLKPGFYQISVTFDDLFLDIADSLPKEVDAGRTTRVTYTVEAGGVIAGTVSIEPGLLTTSPVMVEAFPLGSRTAVREMTLTLVNGVLELPYELRGLASDVYLVRVSVDNLTGFTPFAIAPEYYNGADNTAEAQPVAVNAPERVDDINLTLREGGEIQGGLFWDGQPLNASFSLVYAYEVNTGELYSGVYSGFIGFYSIGNLPAGEYAVAFNPRNLPNASADPSLFNLLLAAPLEGCGNMTPSYFRNAGDLEGAQTIQVEAGEVAFPVDLNVDIGGGLTARVVSEDGACPLQFGFLGVFRGDTLQRFGPILNGSAQFTGLPPGDYALKLADPGLDIDLDPNQDPSDFDLAALFENSLVYEPPIEIVAGQYQTVVWQAPLDVNGQASAGLESSPRLLYPWVSNRAGQFESVLIANNYSDRPIQVTLTANRGQEPPETIVRPIPARGFLEEKASSLFPRLGSGAGYAVTLSAPTDRVRGRWVTNNLQAASGQSPSQGVAVRLDQDNSRLGETLMYGFLPLSDNLISAPVLVNVSEAPIDVTLRFFDADGNQAALEELTDLPPFTPFAQTANALVPEATGDLYMVAESSGGPITGVSFIFNQTFFETAIGNVTRIDGDAADTGEKTLIYPWISNREGQFESVLTAVNHSDQAVEVSLTARRNGNPVQTQTITERIEAGGLLRGLASDLFDDLGSGAGYAVELTAPTSKITGAWVTNNLQAASGQSPSLGVAIDATPGQVDGERAGQNLIYGYLPTTGSLSSAPVIVNVGDAPTDVTLQFFNAAGEPVADNVLSGLPPNLPVAALANNLVPENSGNVYMTASSSGQPLAGAAFVFNTAFFEPAIGNASAIDP